jgi:hypothetical protein
MLKYEILAENPLKFQRKIICVLSTLVHDTVHCVSEGHYEIMISLHLQDIVAHLLKARTIKPAKTTIAMEQLCKRARC